MKGLRQLCGLLGRGHLQMPGAQPTLPSGGRRSRSTCLRFQDNVETFSQAGLKEVLPGPNSVLSSVHFLNSSGGAPGVIDGLRVVEVTTPPASDVWEWCPAEGW